jgi:MFS family permease
MANSMLTQHHAAYALDSGHPPAAIAAMVAVYGAGVVAGNLSGFLADRFGRELTYSGGCVAIFAGLIMLMVAGNPQAGWALTVYAALFGYGFGLISPTGTAAIVDVFQGPHLGAINGLIVVSFGLAGAFSPWLGGFIFDQTGSYTPAFVVALASVVAAATLVWVARPSSVRRVATTLG